ncbi:B9-domain-containing protein [Piromyces finnis]|uniref:B9 domain-containing protein 2 n=1 Tax=Piromyces finnis TaxID=1754191 RepID=A0A1Y1V709_9FUNG|nr:B9-domain-containing protein [Piromyces finnis]|eukprot:ORX48905.1 B9-domain-containing protein [Piromyces finnis]
MAEVHIIGQLTGASGFPSANLSCKWSIVAGEEWTLLEGSIKGHTQVDLPVDARFSVWSHPIDVHYSTKSIKGWPKIQFQIFHQDRFGRNELYGYGFIHVPTTPGMHELECMTWKPLSSNSNKLWEFFLGASSQLRDTDVIHNGADRFRLVTATMGKVHLELGIILRNFSNYGISMS